MAKKTTKRPTKKHPEYTVSVLIWGKTYLGQGATLIEALSSLSVPNPKGKSVLTVQHNGQVKERILTPMATSRLLNSHGLMRQVALKNTSLLFGI